MSFEGYVGGMLLLALPVFAIPAFTKGISVGTETVTLRRSPVLFSLSFAFCGAFLVLSAI